MGEEIKQCKEREPRNERASNNEQKEEQGWKRR
jgi:hypothetical protein